jgi:FtsZ-binding cell division protein ZapB
MWTKLLEFILGLFRRAPERIEPVIEGWGELTHDQRGLIDLLIAEVRALKGEVKGLTAEVKECNDHRNELQRRVETLERRAEAARDYAHDNVHNIKDVLLALEEDLKAAGIPLEVRTEVLLQQQKRRDRRDQ